MVANLIAGGALVVSGIAGLFSWWALDQAKKANKIGLHAYQKEVYEAFFEVQKAFVARGRFLSPSEIAVWAETIHLAPMYLDKKLVDQLKSYFLGCFEIENYRLKVEEEKTKLAYLEISAESISSTDHAKGCLELRKHVEALSNEFEVHLLSMNALGRDLTAAIGSGIKIV